MVYEDPSGYKEITNPNAKGGAYESVPTNGGEIHHMPSDSNSPYGTNKDPGIYMEIEDHAKTASWGSSKSAKEYRTKQKELIEQGKFEESQQMDIDNVRDLCGNKYDQGILEMDSYTDELLKKRPVEKEVGKKKVREKKKNDKANNTNDNEIESKKCK